MLGAPNTRKIAKGFQADTNILSHVIEYISARKRKKLLGKELTEK